MTPTSHAPALQPQTGRWVLRVQGAILGESTRVLARIEDDRSTIFIPKDDIAMAFLTPSDTTGGDGTRYYDIIGKSRTLAKAAWDDPADGALHNHLTFDPRQVTLQQV